MLIITTATTTKTTMMKITTISSSGRSSCCSSTTSMTRSCSKKSSLMLQFLLMLSSSSSWWFNNMNNNSSIGIGLRVVYADTAFTYNDDLECYSPFSTATIDYFSCGGSGGGGDDHNDNDDGGNNGASSAVCTFGDTVTVQGSVTLSSSLPDEICITMKTCLLGVNWMCHEYYQDSMDICEYITRTDDDDDNDDGCPSAGEYTFGGEFDIPQIGSFSNLGSGWWTTIYVDMTNCDDDDDDDSTTTTTSLSTSCKASISAVSSNSSSSSSAMITGLSATFGIAAMIFFFVRKGRSRGRINLLREENLLAGQLHPVGPSVVVSSSGADAYNGSRNKNKNNKNDDNNIQQQQQNNNSTAGHFFEMIQQQQRRDGSVISV